MDEHLSLTVVHETGFQISSAYHVQAVRNSDWQIVWGPAAGTEGLIYTWCDRCSGGVVLRTGGLQPDRVTHRCPRSEGTAYAEELPYGAGLAHGYSVLSFWEIREPGDEGGEEASEGGELRLPVRDVPEEVPELRVRELRDRGFIGRSGARAKQVLQHVFRFGVMA